MTRETKIGLLVSLAFVIAVGVLLSDHMVNNSDAKPASVAVAGPDVVKGLAVPGHAAAGVAAPVAPDQNTSPLTKVPSVAEVTAPAPDAPKTKIVVGGPDTSEIEIAKAASPNLPQRSTDIIITPPPENMASLDPSAHVATLGTGNPTPSPLVPLAAPTTLPTEKKYQDYVAVSGDNVAKMAKRFLGGDTKGNRDLIIAANDVLKKDPTKIVVGKTYRIPIKVAPAPVTVAAAAATHPVAPTPTATVTPATPTKTYVVKSGDNLWKIAKGNAQLVSEIRKLNRDAFKGENLKVGATLRLPAKNNAG